MGLFKVPNLTGYGVVESRTSGVTCDTLITPRWCRHQIIITPPDSFHHLKDFLSLYAGISVIYQEIWYSSTVA